MQNYPSTRSARSGQPFKSLGQSEKTVPDTNWRYETLRRRLDGLGTAAFFEPYTDDPSTSGLLLQPPEVLQKQIFDADAAGYQLVVHAIGDRANAIVLDIFERLVKERGARDRRPRIEHAQVVRAADKPRFKALGVIASIQPSHCIDDMRWAERRIGKQRTPFRTTSSRSRTQARGSPSAPTGMSSPSTPCWDCTRR